MFDAMTYSELHHLSQSLLRSMDKLDGLRHGELVLDLARTHTSVCRAMALAA